MVVSLVKKDFKLIRNSLLILFAICAFAPLLMIVQTRENLYRIGPFAYIYLSFLANLSYLQTVTLEEEKYGNAVSLICAAPLKRNVYVTAKLVSFLLFAVGCVLSYSVVSLFSNMNHLSLFDVALVLMTGMIFYGVYTPVSVRYGNAKARIVFTIAIVVIALLPVTLTNVFSYNVVNVFKAFQHPTGALTFIFLIISVIIAFASTGIAVKLFNNKEL